jgi:hypothetical protein
LGYDGRVLSHPKFTGMRPEALTTDTVAYAADLIAIVDPTDTKVRAPSSIRLTLALYRLSA